MLAAAAERARAVAETHFRDEDPVGVDDMYVAHRALGIWTSLHAMAEVHHKPDIG